MQKNGFGIGLERVYTNKEVIKLISTDELKKWISNNRIEEKATNSFWDYIRYYKEEETEDFESDFGQDFKEDYLKIMVDTISLSITKIERTVIEYVVVYIPIVYNESDIGMYKVIFSLSGEIEDEYITIEESWKKACKH